MCPEAGGRPVAVGVDIGSAAAKAVVLASGNTLSWAIAPSGGDYRLAAEGVVSTTLEKLGLAVADISYMVATGCGADRVVGADATATDVACHGRGVVYLFDSVRTVVDIGGQFTRVFRIDGAGGVVNFLYSEKCAAGSGRMLQMIARVLRVEVGELGELSLKSKNRVNFTTGCAVFSESEAVSRIAEGADKEDIAAGIQRALAAKVQTLVERLGFKPDGALVGGAANNIGLVRSIEEMLGITMLVPEEPQITAALGAALLAAERLNMAVPESDRK